MTTSAKSQLPEGNQDAIISALVLFILDQLDQTVNTPESHYNYLRAIFQRYPLQVVIAEMRNILAALYFPQAADLSQLVMQYHDITLVPQQKAGGYCITFLYKEALHSTPITTAPLKSLELAQHMIDQLRAGVQLTSSIMEERVDHDNAQAGKVPAADTIPTSPPATQPSPAFIRIGRVALAIDKLLYVKDDSTADYQSVRVGLAGGVDMRLDGNSTHNAIHTQEVRFVGEEAQAFLNWQRSFTLAAVPDGNAGRSKHEFSSFEGKGGKDGPGK